MMKRFLSAFALLLSIGAAQAQLLPYSPALPGAAGSFGQVQYNNGGSLGGLTVGGDATLNTGTGALTVAKIQGTTINSVPASGNLVGTTDSQTLMNKTLTAPIIATISNGGTLTLPSGPDTLVGRASTDTLTNKTLTSPTIGGTLTLPDGALWSSSGLSDTASYSTSSTNVLNISPTWTFTSTGNNIGPIQFGPTLIPSGASAGNIYAFKTLVGLNAGSVNVSTVRGMWSSLNITAGYTGTISTYNDFVADGGANAGNPFTNFNLYLAAGSANGNGITSGTVTNTGLNVSAWTAAAGAGGTVSNTGVQVTLPTSSSAGNTDRGIYITGNGGAASTKYAIYSDSTAPSQFSGALLQTGTYLISSSANGSSGGWQANSAQIYGGTTPSFYASGSDSSTLATGWQIGRAHANGSGGVADVGSDASGNINIGASLTVGQSSPLTVNTGGLGGTKTTASASAPGAAGGKIEWRCGTNAGTIKIVAYGGTSSTGVTVTDNIGSGVSGC